MRILTYKRTHVGDPDEHGIFGVNDCMGAIRNRKYDAVVGIGSKTPWSDSNEIAGKVNWVGVGPIRYYSKDRRGDVIGFERFILLDGNGPAFEDVAPNLAKRFYQGKARSIINSYSTLEKEEIVSVITDLIKDVEPKFYDSNLLKEKLTKRRNKCAKIICPNSC